MPTNMKRTNVYLGEQDQIDAKYIQDECGLASISSAVRMSVRRIARQLRAESVKRRPTSRTQEAEG